MNLQDLLERYNVPHVTHGQHHHARRGWVNTDCPECSPAWGHWRLGFNLRGGYANCWSCGRVWAPLALAELTGEPLPVVRKLLEDLDGVDPNFAKDAPKARGKYTEPKGVKQMTRPFTNYLKERGFRDALGLAQEWGLRCVAQSGTEVDWRVFVPITFRREPVSWTARAIGDQVEPRYYSAPPDMEKMSHKDLVFGEDRCRGSIVVVEGPLDVLAVGPGAGCTFGTAWRQAQVLRIARFARRAVCFDAEPAAQKRARELCDLLAAFPGDTVNITLDGGKDPAELLQKRKMKELKQLRSFAR